MAPDPALNYPRIAGIDYGTKRVGLAVSDPLGMFAQPVGTFDPDEALHALRRIERESGLSACVVGWPLLEDGSEGAATERVSQYINRIRKAFPGVVIHRMDERYTSEEARSRLRERPTGRPAGRARVDTLAAGLILQEFLDAATG